MNKILLCGLLLCLIGAGGKGYGQEVDIKTDKRYGGLVAAWNFDGDTNEFLSGDTLKANKGEVVYTMDRNLEEGKALLVQKGQFLSGLNELLPQEDSRRTVMFWMRKTGCGNADITLLHFGDNSKPRGSMNIRLRPCAEWGDYMTTSFVPDLEGNHKYSDALDRNFYDGFWSHITITYSKGIVRAHYNGSAVRNYPSSSSSQKADTASAEVALGWVMSSNENDDTVICLDEVRVFSSLLNSRKIKLIYENEFSGRGEADTDGDGLSDSHEVFLLKTNPDLADTDDDGLTDLFEVQDGVFGVVEGSYTWHAAHSDAQKRGGHLATITSEVENLVLFDFLKNKYNKIPCLWLGATDEKKEGKWTWVTGEPWNYNNWIKNGFEPSNNDQKEHYLQIYGAVAYDTYYNTGSTYVYGTHFGWNDNIAKVNGGADTPVGYLIEFSKLNPLDPDSDDDGYLDGEEIRAKTNPADATSYPSSSANISITELQRAPFAFSFGAKEGRVYDVQSSQDLRSWGTLKTYNGTGTLIRFEDERDQVFPQIYYRVRVVN